jgi:hypothetical protein
MCVNNPDRSPARRAEKNGVRVVAIGCATLILGKALQFGSTPLGPDLEPNKVIAFVTAHQKKACFPIDEIHVINFFNKPPSAGWISTSDVRPLAGKLAGAI